MVVESPRYSYDYIVIIIKIDLRSFIRFIENKLFILKLIKSQLLHFFMQDGIVVSSLKIYSISLGKAFSVTFPITTAL